MGLGDETSSIPSGASDEHAGSTAPVVSEESSPKGRIRRAFSSSRELVRIAYRDPEHVSERLTLYTAGRLGDPSREWAQSALSSRPDSHPAEIAEELRTDSAHVARIDGAIAGTPFFIALVPGYLTYLVQEMRMTLRTAALYDRDPTDLHTSAEMLAAPRHTPRRRGRGGGAGCGPRAGDPGSAAEAAIVAHVGAQRVLAARLRGLHVAVCRQGGQGHARQGQGGVERARGRGYLADDVRVPGHVHGRDGMGLRDPRAPARPPNASLLRRWRPRASLTRSRSPISDKTAATTNARLSVPSSCSSRSQFRSGSSHTSITFGKRSGLVGWARSVRSLRSRW